MKTTRRIISMLIVLCTLISMLPAQVFAEESSLEQVQAETIETISDDVHEHSYTTVVTAPTCTEQGYTTYTCACGDSYVDTYVDAAGHSFGEWYETVAATTETEGEERRDCANCDAYETRVTEKLTTEDDEEETIGGTCGDNLTWEFDEDNGILIIRGTGDMYDFEFSGEHANPWRSFAIEKVIIESGVSNIGQYAFTKGPEYDIPSISIPDTVTRFENYAFYGSGSLGEIYIPANVEYIGTRVFSECRVPAITVDSQNTHFCNDESGALLTIDGSELIRLPSSFNGKYTVPDGVQTIREDAFMGCTAMTEITIPETVTEIGETAFYYCIGLREVTLPTALTQTSDLLFSLSENITAIKLPDNLKIIGTGTFHGCTNLKEIVIPESVTNINDRAFGYCENLEQIVFAGDAPAFHETAFSNVETYVKYPANNSTWTTDIIQDYGGTITWVAYIEDHTHEYDEDHKCECGAIGGSCGENLNWAFDEEGTLRISGSGAMDAIAFDSVAGQYLTPWKDWQDHIKSVVIESGITDVADQAIGSCENLATITIPATVTKLGDFAILSCPSLKEIQVDDENLHYCTVDGVLYSKDMTTLIKYPACRPGTAYTVPDTVTKLMHTAFDSSSNLVNITLPDNITVLDTDTFADCTSLKNIRLPKNLTQMEAGSIFWKCSSLESIEIPDNVQVIGVSAFAYCPNLKQVTLPTGLKKNDGHAFGRCESLETITIPAGVNCLEYKIFEGSGLKSITFEGDAPDFHEEAFTNIIATAYYPANNSTWTSDVMQDYGGSIFWVPYGGQTDVSIAGTVTEPLNVYSVPTSNSSVLTTLESGTLVEILRVVIFMDQPWGLIETGWIPLDSVDLDHYVVKSITLSQEHITLQIGQSCQLTAEVLPVVLASNLSWHAEDGSEEIVSVDAEGNVTALTEGTAYIIATVTDGKNELSARCCVDVTESIEVDGIQLSTDKVTAELFSTDYATFEILLQLPQNYSAAEATDSQLNRNSGITIADAQFTDKTVDELFDLVVLDDRRVQVVPTESAIKNPGAVEKSYSSTVTVTINGLEEPFVTEEALTLTVRQTKPALTAKIDPFNSFYTQQSREIWISGGTVTGISLNEAMENPDWLDLKDNCLVLNENAPNKSTSAKVVLTVETEEWAIPVEVTLSVKNSYKKPALKLSSSTVTMVKDALLSNGTSLTLKPSAKDDTLAKWNVRDIAAPEGYVISDFNPETGTFLLKAEEGFKAGKINLTVSFNDTDNVLTLPLTVKTAAVALKRDKSSITLNRALEDSAVITITATPADYALDLTEENLRLADSKGTSLADDSILDFTVSDNRITVSTNDSTPVGTYRICVSVDGSKEVYTTVKVVDKAPAVSFQAKGTLDLSFPNNEVVITPSFKNYTGGTYEVASWSVVEKKDREDVTSFFDLDAETLALSWNEENVDDLTSGKAYEVTLKLSLPGVTEPVSGKVSLTMKRTAIKLRLSKASVSLNKLLDDSTEVTVSCVTEGYNFTAPMMELWNGKTLLESGKKLTDNGKLLVTWEDGRIHIELDEEAEYGEKFQIKLRANEYSTVHTIKVTIPTEAKSRVTVSLKAQGSIDVIRGGSQIILTPGYKNCTEGKDWVEELFIYTSESKYQTAIPAEELFSIEEANGTYVLTAKEGLNHKVKYKIQLVSSLNDLEFKSSPVSISVKMGAAKLTMTASDTTLFAKDKNDRVGLSFSAKDKTLNQVARVEIKDNKYKNVFEIFDYGNGEFAIGFKDGIVDSCIQGKTITLNLNVFLEGNETSTANTTMKLKLTVVK